MLLFMLLYLLERDLRGFATRLARLVRILLSQRVAQGVSRMVTDRMFSRT